MSSQDAAAIFVGISAAIVVLAFIGIAISELIG